MQTTMSLQLMRAALIIRHLYTTLTLGPSHTHITHGSCPLFLKRAISQTSSPTLWSHSWHTLGNRISYKNTTSSSMWVYALHIVYTYYIYLSFSLHFISSWSICCCCSSLTTHLLTRTARLLQPIILHRKNISVIYIKHILGLSPATHLIIIIAFKSSAKSHTSSFAEYASDRDRPNWLYSRLLISRLTEDALRLEDNRSASPILHCVFDLHFGVRYVHSAQVVLEWVLRMEAVVSIIQCGMTWRLKLKNANSLEF